MDFGWGALITGIVDFAGKYISYQHAKLLRQHSDLYLALEKSLREEMMKSYGDMDDFKIADLRVQMKAVREAFARDIAIAGGKDAAPSV